MSNKVKDIFYAILVGVVITSAIGLISLILFMVVTNVCFNPVVFFIMLFIEIASAIALSFYNNYLD